MNLYNLHTDPKSLKHHDFHHNTVPDLFWDKYGNNPAELKKREQAIAKDPGYAVMYARDVIKRPWKPGEAAIAKDPLTVLDDGEVNCVALDYAKHVLHGRFPAGEKVIASNPVTAYEYAKDVLHGRFPAGEKAIADDKDHTEDCGIARDYARFIIKGPWTFDGKTFEPSTKEFWET
jgi:hypothetical protein